MRHRIFIDAIQPTVTVTGDEFHHSVRVVRLREGEEVEVFDRTGRMARATVDSIARDHAVLSLGDEIPSRESALGLTLAMSIINLDKFELVLQKATELGVRAVIPLITDRIELRPERFAGKTERWERIVFEAVKQSGRSVVPKIESARKFDDVITCAGTKIVFDADTSPSPAEPRGGAILFIGPEGGFSERELDLARKHCAIFQRLGPRRLRAETAALVAIVTTAVRSGELD